MRTRIGTQLILGAGLVTALAIGALAVLVLRAHETALVSELKLGADQLSETIKNSTHYDMLENRRDNLQRQIAHLGRQDGIEAVRVFNKEGRVVFSSEPAELGQAWTSAAWPAPPATPRIARSSGPRRRRARACSPLPTATACSASSTRSGTSRAARGAATSTGRATACWACST